MSDSRQDVLCLYSTFDCFGLSRIFAKLLKAFLPRIQTVWICLEPRPVQCSPGVQGLMEEDLDVELGEAGRNWERPALPALNPKKQGICKHPGFRTFT